MIEGVRVGEGGKDKGVRVGERRAVEGVWGEWWSRWFVEEWERCQQGGGYVR